MKNLICAALATFLVPTVTLARGVENSTWSIPGSSQIIVSVSNGNFIVDYPNLGCSGYWDLTGRTGGSSYNFTERLTSGNKCTDGAKIRAFIGIPGRMKVETRGRKPRNFNGVLKLQKMSSHASLIEPPNYGTIPNRLPTQEELQQIQEEKSRLAEEKRAQERNKKEAERRERDRQKRQRKAELKEQKLIEREDRVRRSKEYIDFVKIDKSVSVNDDLSTQNSGAGITSFANTRLDYHLYIEDRLVIDNKVPIFMIISADSIVRKTDGSDRRKSFFLKRKLDLCDGYYVVLHSGNNYSYRRSAENSVSVRNEFEGIGGIWNGLTRENWIGENLDVEIDILLASAEPDLVLQRRSRYDFCFFDSNEKELWRSYLEN